MVLVGICLFWKFENRVVWSGNYGELPCFAVMDPFGELFGCIIGFVGNYRVLCDVFFCVNCGDLPRYSGDCVRKMR